MERTEQMKERIGSLERLRELGIDPYPAAEFKYTAKVKDIVENENDYMDKVVTVAGRLMSFRIMGKAAFAEIKDGVHRMQIYVRRDDICPGEDKTLYNEVFKKLLDIGDHAGFKGKIFKTQKGELSVWVEELTLLSKSIRPLPVVKTDAEGNVHDSVNDKEFRYRQRYVDLVINDHVKDVFYKRTQIIQEIRNYFNSFGYLEVDTPVLQSIPGGANARPFITHHNALNIPLYLRIANELYLKRLIVGGFEGVYEFSKNFRNEGMDSTHNPEFTALEIYIAYKDYFWMMDFTENLIRTVCEKVIGNMELPYGDNLINFGEKFKRFSFQGVFVEFTGTDYCAMNDADLEKAAKELKIDLPKNPNRTQLLDELFGELIEDKLIQPTFITDYPVEMSPLCKRHREDPNYAERFELFINGKEIANSYSELNDPIDQLQRFQDQVALKDAGDDEAMYLDYDFVRALEYGMPPAGGLGIGIDRLIMMLTNNTSIQEVLFFPQMKPERRAGDDESKEEGKETEQDS